MVGKNVKILVSSNSGARTGNAEPTRVDKYNQILVSQKSIISISVVEE